MAKTAETMEYADKIALTEGHKGDPRWSMSKQQRNESFLGKHVRRQVQTGGSDSRSTADIIRDAAGDRVHKGKGKKREREHEQSTWQSRSQPDSQWYDDRRRQSKGKGSWSSSSSSAWWQSMN